ncbi:MAG: C-GCAxxG-C-C family protein [Spirochaetes bacterium]|nr:C-GCAxxG-C-C family protein [Spirochaetota bacterium]
MTRAERAVALHLGGSACSQAVFSVFAKDLGMDEKVAHRLSTGFGGGVGRKGLLCGALSGGVLAISLLYGGETGEDQEAKLKTYAVVTKFIGEMEKRHGSTQCRALLGGIDLWNEADQAMMKAEGLSGKVCNALIADVVEYVEGLFPPEM